jgi:hypothetical protein
MLKMKICPNHISVVVVVVVAAAAAAVVVVTITRGSVMDPNDP